MTTRYVLLLSYSDRSGPIQAFGPYDTPEQAKAAEDEIGSWPSIHPGVWHVLPCTDPTPASMVRGFFANAAPQPFVHAATPTAPLPCGYCGCTEPPTECACNHG